MGRTQFLQLPPEIREQIYSHCSRSELLNLACCSKRCYQDFGVKQHLWCQVKVKSSDVTDNKHVIKRRRNCLKFTKRLTISASKGNNGIDTYKDKGAIACYKYFIQSFDPHCLTEFNLNGYIVKSVLRVTSRFLTNIKNITVSGVQMRSSDWDHLGEFKALVTLSLHDCNVYDRHFEKVKLLTHLEDLKVMQCLQTTCTTLYHISNITTLKKLTFSNHKGIDNEGYTIAINNNKLPRLTELDLSYTYISDDFFAGVGQSLHNVTYLNLAWCVYLTDLGLFYLSSLKMLKKLDISFSFFISDAGLIHISKFSSLTSLVLLACIEVTDFGFLHLVALKHLQEINIKFCTQITQQAMDTFTKSYTRPPTILVT